MGWKELLRQHSSDFISWLESERVLIGSATHVATSLADLVIDRVVTPDDARHTWAAVPAVLARCNEMETYGLPFSAEAYAWLHFTSRYVRTWKAHLELVKSLSLPLGIRGVRVLDVGAGPGQSVLATSNFYRAIEMFARDRAIRPLAQSADITAVERGPGWYVFSHLCERLNDFFEVKGHFSDFFEIDFEAMRNDLKERFIDAYWDDEPSGQYPHFESVSAANDGAQRAYRFRFLIFSNFLTTPGVVEAFRAVILRLLSDMSAGSVVLLIGATGGMYGDVYTLVDELTDQAGFVKTIDRLPVSEDIESARIGFEQSKRVFDHLQLLHPVDGSQNADIQRVVSYFRGDTPSVLKSTIVCYRKPGTNG